MSPGLSVIDCSTNDDHFAALKEHVIHATGLSYYADREHELASCLSRRFQETGVSSCRGYLRLLKSSALADDEFDRLIETLTIGETYFFRYPEMFAALEHSILPEVIGRNRQQQRLRIWSAGASIGAEAYSLSILLRRQLAKRLYGWDISIVGTDINRSFLARAAEAQFEPWAMRGLSDDVKQDCFLPCGDVWTLKPEYRQGVSFRYHNLATHPFPSLLNNLLAFDVILCRNVMIYFGGQQNQRIIAQLRDCLDPQGWLLVGHAEHTLQPFRGFRSVRLGETTAYQRTEESRRSNSHVDRCPVDRVRTPPAELKWPYHHVEAFES